MRRLIFIAIVFLSAAAYGNFEITCYKDDCLTHGWEAFDHWNFKLSTVMCISSDCATEGWSELFEGRSSSETRCKGGGCFTDGWLIYDSRSGAPMAEVTCRMVDSGEKDCLTNGWTVADPRGFVRQTVRCLNSDCENSGWDILTPGFPIMVSRCKLGGCFQAGWIQYR